MRRSAFVLAAVVLPAVTAAQQRAFTADDYRRAQARTQAPPAVLALANTGRVSANWIAGDRFWYRDSSAAGVQFHLVDPARRSRTPAFDHARVASALSTASGTTVEATRLPFTTLTFSADARSVTVSVGGRSFSCPVGGGTCTAVATPDTVAGGRGGRGGVGGRGGLPGGRGNVAGGGGRGGAGGGGPTSPDGRYGTFIRDFNLFARDNTTNQEIQLTRDGVTDFGYATDNAGWTSSPNAVLLWSPDSRKIATQQQDERGVGDMYLVSTPVGGASGRMGGHPVLRAWNYPLPGDSIVTTIQRVIIDVPTRTVVRLKMARDEHRAVQGDDIDMGDIKWAPDASRIVFASVSRDHKQVWIREANATTGDVRQIFTETSPTHIENWAGGWHVLWGSNEIVWYSQRDNYGQLYLYDLRTGALKNKITSGTVNVTSISRIDDTTRTIWFTGQGGIAGENPYYAHHYRVKMDGTGQVLLNPGDGVHEAPAYSPSRRYFVDTWSQTEVPPQAAVRDANTGELLLQLTRPADTAALRRLGWNSVKTVRMKGRDGTTDVYGQMYRPSTLNPNQKYPIINHIYPGPQSGSVGGGWAFKAGGGEPQGLADVGFVVVQINGMGTPGRDKKFMDAYYGNMIDNTIPDQVAGMKELAQRFPYIDIERTGIWGHSGGGFATAAAMFMAPDFFKVGISESGNHDNRNYEDDWGERYQGLLKMNPDGTSNYDSIATQTFAKNLKGKLLLAHGTMDNNVPPFNTYMVVDALIKAGKMFDLLMFPNAGHGFGAAGQYMVCRRWNYFAQHLLDMKPMDDCSVAAQPAAAGGGRGRGGGPRSR